MARYEICPISPGNMYWQAFGPSEHLYEMGSPVASRKTPQGAKNYAIKHSNEYQYGLCVVDTEKRRVDWGGTQKMIWSDPFSQDEE